MALSPDHDPRRHMASDELEAASVRAMPQVAARPGSTDWLSVGGLVGVMALGVIVWLSLSSPPLPPSSLPPPTQVPPLWPAFTPSVLPHIDPLIGHATATPPAVFIQPAPIDNAAPSTMAREHDSPLIMDVTSPPEAVPDGTSANGGAVLNANDTFAAGLSVDTTQKARMIGDPARVVPQGAVIPAVLETAINSDLPGYTRAIVSRDIRSFDGAVVLIPRGSRLVGQYKSGLAGGETRAFVIWTRLIRPDGLSIQLASPATDNLGQAGTTGKVDSHFAKRFGSSILLSLVNGLSGSLNNGSPSTIVIGTSSQATDVAMEALSLDNKIPPTIRVSPGAEILVFAARDLDFSIGY